MVQPQTTRSKLLSIFVFSEIIFKKSSLLIDVNVGITGADRSIFLLVSGYWVIQGSGEKHRRVSVNGLVKDLFCPSLKIRIFLYIICILKENSYEDIVDEFSEGLR